MTQINSSSVDFYTSGPDDAIGIEVKDGQFVPMIEAGWAIPCSKSRVFTTVADDQTRVEIRVLVGSSDLVAHNRSLAKFELTDIPPAPKGVAQIELTIKIDGPGRIVVRAEDQATGHHQGVAISPAGGLTQEEVERLVEETRRLEAEKEQGARGRPMGGDKYEEFEPGHPDYGLRRDGTIYGLGFLRSFCRRCGAEMDVNEPEALREEAPGLCPKCEVQGSSSHD